MREPIDQLIEPVHEATFTVRGTMIEISVTSKDLNERGMIKDTATRLDKATQNVLQASERGLGQNSV